MASLGDILRLVWEPDRLTLFWFKESNDESFWVNEKSAIDCFLVFSTSLGDILTCGSVSPLLFGTAAAAAAAGGVGEVVGLLRELAWSSGCKREQNKSAVAPSSSRAWAGATCYWNEVFLWNVSDLWKDGLSRDNEGHSCAKLRAKLLSLLGLGKCPFANALPMEPRSSMSWCLCWLTDSSELLLSSQCSVAATEARAVTIAFTVLPSLVISSLLLTIEGFFPILFNLEKIDTFSVKIHGSKIRGSKIRGSNDINSNYYEQLIFLLDSNTHSVHKYLQTHQINYTKWQVMLTFPQQHSPWFVSWEDTSRGRCWNVQRSNWRDCSKFQLELKQYVERSSANKSHQNTSHHWVKLPLHHSTWRCPRFLLGWKTFCSRWFLLWWWCLLLNKYSKLWYWLTDT